MMPDLHLLIRMLYDYLRLAEYMWARDAFPNGVPIMDGSGYPRAYRDNIEKKLADAKKWIREKAAAAPLKMIILTPDPIQGGSSDNGPTARQFFHQNNREGILDLFPTATPHERISLGQIYRFKFQVKTSKGPDHLLPLLVYNKYYQKY